MAFLIIIPRFGSSGRDVRAGCNVTYPPYVTWVVRAEESVEVGRRQECFRGCFAESNDMLNGKDKGAGGAGIPLWIG